MTSDARVILLELNELTPPLMERFIAEGRLPNLQRFRDESTVYTTVAAEQPPALEPWIQWVTVHTGMDYADHHVFNLNEGHHLKARRLWDILRDQGVRSVVCGSMNPAYEPGFDGVLVPDPWCTEVEPTPAEVKPFFRFIQQNVLEYSNDRLPLSPRDYAAFGLFMARHGLTPATVKSIAQQLAAERIGVAGRWRRTVILDKLLLDVFFHTVRATGARFSTLFLNSVAHFQHSYWRHFDPAAFPAKPSAEELTEYGPAVTFGYEQMDRSIGRVLEFAGDDTTVILSTALSQQPCTKYDDAGGAYFHRPHEWSNVTRFAGVTAPFHAAPVMVHQSHLEFANEATAADAATKLRALRVQGAQALEVELKGSRVFVGCRMYRPIEQGTRVTVDGSDRAAPFHELFYQMDVVKSGMHHPDGILWIRTPARKHVEVSGRVPLASVAPTVLKLFGVARPEQMKTPALALGDEVLAARREQPAAASATS